MSEHRELEVTGAREHATFLQKLREVDQVFEPDLSKIPEDFVQKLWNTQRYFNANLTSIDGQEIRVLKPGVWNQEEGPDFMHAEIEINGKLQVGDVEIHVKSSEWYAHQHHLNSRYNRVILHTVYFDDALNLRARLQNGKRIPTLELLKWIDTPIGDLFDETTETDTDTTDYCRITGNRLDIETLREVLESLGRERFLEKADSIRLLRTRLDFEQILYEGIMEALGYKRNSTPLRELAQRVPFSDFDDKSEPEIQAILFGVAGLLPSQREKPLPTEEAADPFIVTLEKLWDISEHATRHNRMNTERWRFGGVRPTNYAPRRIAAMSQLIHRCNGSLMMHFLPTCEKAAAANTPELLRAVQKELLELLILEPTDYWSTRYDLGKKSSRKTTFIGASRALDIVINKILPAAYTWAVEAESRELQEAILQLYSVCAESQENQDIRQIKKQLFTEAQPMKLLPRTAKIQQGAIRLHRNYCTDRLCDLCPILEHNAVFLEAESDTQA